MSISNASFSSLVRVIGVSHNKLFFLIRFFIRDKNCLSNLITSPLRFLYFLITDAPSVVLCFFGKSNKSLTLIICNLYCISIKITFYLVGNTPILKCLVERLDTDFLTEIFMVRVCLVFWVF